MNGNLSYSSEEEVEDNPDFFQDQPEKEIKIGRLICNNDKLKKLKIKLLK